ncbi:phosphatidate cytidylyltransferase [Flavobacterium celericrescens]|uniref:Phosphatidate cytidylyltransferase n=1 Tax=Flavobacterium celericrescens TaxID=2709780 RepID=A0ABX0ID32_9FLAO|nr:phosphatidate cytidylyltransferase [Flavobacterium celericrescens]NHM03779.1 phosphatidate cytidylyltransferase [Flavobacterium celericrescens]
MNETLKRAISGAVYIALLLGCISYSKESLAILFGVFLLIGVYEFCKIAALNLYFSIPIAALSYFFLWDKNQDIISKTILVSLSTIISIKLLLYLFNSQKTNFTIATRYLLLIGYIIIPFIITNYVAVGKNGYNPKILISILILIWANDTFAYLVGKNFGKNKLFPSVSPKKTIEGFIGGMLFTIISSVLLSKFYIESKILYIWIVIAIIVSIFSTLGDLIQSKFKRVAGVKDSGKIMPGHGGILDRLDSIIFVIPFINLFYLILYYVS